MDKYDGGRWGWVTVRHVLESQEAWRRWRADDRDTARIFLIPKRDPRTRLNHVAGPAHHDCHRNEAMSLNRICWYEARSMVADLSTSRVVGFQLPGLRVAHRRRSSRLRGVPWSTQGSKFRCEMAMVRFTNRLGRRRRGSGQSDATARPRW
jgi:hypothetical protein